MHKQLAVEGAPSQRQYTEPVHTLSSAQSTKLVLYRTQFFLQLIVHNVVLVACWLGWFLIFTPKLLSFKLSFKL